MPAAPTENGYEHRQVWDRITRSWHWLLATSVTAGWLLGEFRTFSIMQWHIYAGYCTGCLLLFRLAWGFFGPTEVRFRSLIPRPGEVFSYLGLFPKREPSGIHGHSPLGSLAVLMMLALLATQVTSGLFSEDDGLFYSGPLADSVSSGTVRQATAIHNQVAMLILILAALHVSVMAVYYFWKRENLVIAMITGRKLVRKEASKESELKAFLR